MKKIIFIFIVLFSYSLSQAQAVKSYLPTPGFSNALSKIVLDFRYGFYNIQVDSLFTQENGYEVYGSSVTLPGSTDNEIMRFHSVQDTTASYQASFYQGDDYNEAVRNYKSCIHLLKKSLFNWLDKTPTSFSGKEDEPNPNLSFTSTLLRVNNKKDPQYKDFCAEVEMAGDVNGWKVYIIFEVKPSSNDGSSED